jgi:hypothetical protein
MATLRAVASWLFFGVARSLRITSDMLVVSASAARTALKNSQLTDGESHVIYGTGHYQTVETVGVFRPRISGEALPTAKSNRTLQPLTFPRYVQPARTKRIRYVLRGQTGFPKKIPPLTLV